MFLFKQIKTSFVYLPKFYFSQKPLISIPFKRDYNYSPIFAHKEIKFQGIEIVKSVFLSSTPLIFYYLLSKIIGFDIERLTMFILVGLPLSLPQITFNRVDRTIKELHVNKNGKDFIAVFGKKSSIFNRTQLRQENNQAAFKIKMIQNYRYIPLSFVEFNYDNIESIKPTADKTVIKVKKNGIKYNLWLYMDKNLTPEYQEYLNLFIQKQNISI